MFQLSDFEWVSVINLQHVSSLLSLSRVNVRVLVAGKNLELLEKMEVLFNVWHNQIEQVLTEHEQIRREADNIGPDVELQYWKNRMDKFHMYDSFYVLRHAQRQLNAAIVCRPDAVFELSKRGWGQQQGRKAEMRFLRTPDVISCP